MTARIDFGNPLAKAVFGAAAGLLAAGVTAALCVACQIKRDEAEDGDNESDEAAKHSIDVMMESDCRRIGSALECGHYDMALKPVEACLNDLGSYQGELDQNTERYVDEYDFAPTKEDQLNYVLDHYDEILSAWARMVQGMNPRTRSVYMDRYNEAFSELHDWPRI